MRWKEVLAWGSYDLANTAFSALFVTFFFPFYVKEFLGGTEFQIGLTFGLSMLAVGILVPVIGAWSDRLNNRMRFIITFTVLCIIATAITGYAGLAAALLLGGIANFLYHGALTTYNALLTKLATPGERGFVSGIGVSLGYIGTLLSLGMATLLLQKYGWETLAGTRAVFIGTAAFFLLFSLITFSTIREGKISSGQIGNAFSRVWKTVKSFRSYKGLLSFIFTMLFYGDGVNAVIIFLFLFARSAIGLDVKAFMVVYAIFAAAAAIGAIVFGKISDRWGPKRALSLSGVLWCVVVGVLMLVSTYKVFVLAGSLGGIALGGVWTAMRPLTLQLAPRKQAGEFFGFLELTDKFSGVLGPIVFGYLASAYSYHAALTSVLVFFLLGLAMLTGVPGRTDAN